MIDIMQKEKRKEFRLINIVYLKTLLKNNDQTCVLFNCVIHTVYHSRLSHIEISYIKQF